MNSVTLTKFNLATLYLTSRQSIFLNPQSVFSYLLLAHHVSLSVHCIPLSAYLIALFLHHKSLGIHHIVMNIFLCRLPYLYIDLQIHIYTIHNLYMIARNQTIPFPLFVLFQCLHIVVEIILKDIPNKSFSI